MKIKYFVCLMILILCSVKASYASGWTVKTTYAGTTTAQVDNNAPSFYNWSSGKSPILAVGDASVEPGHSASCSAIGTITMKWTWTATGTDPNPPYVVVAYQPYAIATGDTVTCDDGNSDSPDVSGTTSVAEPPHHNGATYDNETTTSFSRSFSMNASASVSVPVGGQAEPCSVGVSLGGFIHAQPYNFVQTSSRTNADSSITFVYSWLSTSGNLNDIDSNVTVHEIVLYTGQPGTYSPGNLLYYPSSPPISAGYGYQNPTDGDRIPGSSGGDIFSDTQSTPTFLQPYTPLQYVGVQNYVFDDLDTNVMSNQLLGPFSIVRTVSQNPTLYYYKINKNGVSSNPVLLLPNQ